jgi:hypothetical protein
LQKVRVTLPKIRIVISVTDWSGGSSMMRGKRPKKRGTCLALSRVADGLNIYGREP